MIVEVSNNGGASFTKIASYTLNGNTTTPISQSFDISDFISANTQIRFLMSANNSTNSIYIDNIQIATESACPTTGGFVIEHDGTGVHCLDEKFQVVARSSDDTTQVGYSQQVTLTTGKGVGTFATTESNAGQFLDAVADDGEAVYVFSEKDQGEAVFLLNYSGGSDGSAGDTVDLDVYQTSQSQVQDDDSEGPLVFAPSGLLLTANAIPDPAPQRISDPISAQTAGSAFRVHLSAYGTSSANPDCGVVESYSGVHGIYFWSQYVDPTSGSIPVYVDSASVGTSEGNATGMKIEFEKGRAVVVAEYKDAGRLYLHAKDPDEVPPTGGIRGSTDAFVSRPANLEIFDVERPDETPNPKGDDPAEEAFVAAGSPFRVSVRALDADGDLTPNFGQESTPEKVRVRSASLVAPAGGRNGSANDGTIAGGDLFVLVKPGGTFENTAASFDEVGAIRLQASVTDSDYLGTGALSGELSDVVGRFTPSRFEVTANTPQWETGCSTGAFTWAGQPFGYRTGFAPKLSVRAVAASGDTTANYTGTWWRLTNASLGERSYAISQGSLDESGLPAASADPAISNISLGEGVLTFSAGTGLAVNRTPLVAPFDAEVELSIEIKDLDGIAYAANPFRFGGTTTGAGMDFSVSKRVQVGRLRLGNAFGSELVDLPMKLVTQRFDGTRFVDDSNDSCSRVTEDDLTLSPAPASLVAAPTIGNQPLFSGDGGLVLGAPAAVGSVAVEVDLSSTGANLPWLRFDWPQDGNLDGVLDDDPSAEATFGIWPGRPGQIFQQEVY